MIFNGQGPVFDGDCDRLDLSNFLINIPGHMATMPA